MGKGVGEIGCIKSISVGNQFHKELLFSKAKASALSLFFLSQYDVVTFDCRNKIIYFKKIRQSEGSEKGRGEQTDRKKDNHR
jgi:chemotaxis methyl-accepting protein methylase